MQTSAVKQVRFPTTPILSVPRVVSCALSTGLPTAPPPACLATFLASAPWGRLVLFVEALAYVIFEGCPLATAVLCTVYGFAEMLCEEALCAQRLRSHGDGQLEWVHTTRTSRTLTIFAWQQGPANRGSWLKGVHEGPFGAYLEDTGGT